MHHRYSAEVFNHYALHKRRAARKFLAGVFFAGRDCEVARNTHIYVVVMFDTISLNINISGRWLLHEPLYLSVIEPL